MYSLLTLILTALGAAFAGGVGSWYGIRDRKYMPLKIQHDKNEKALMQLTDTYTAGKAQYADLQTRFKDTELANSKTSADFKIISDERVALTNEFNIYELESEKRTAELGAEIKKLTESVEKHTEADTRFNKLSKEYASAIEERKILNATTINLVSEKQTLLSEYGNFKTEANQKYNALKTHLDKLQNPYAAYADADENENGRKAQPYIFPAHIFSDLSESTIAVANESVHPIETEKPAPTKPDPDLAHTPIAAAPKPDNRWTDAIQITDYFEEEK